MEEKGLKNWLNYFQPWPRDPNQKRRSHSWDLPEEYDSNVFIAARSNAFIDRAHESSKPFFLWASFPDPHPPYLVPEPWASMYDPEDMEPGELVPGEHVKNPPHFQLTQQEKPDYSAYAETWGNHGFQSHLHERKAFQKNLAVY